MSDLVQNTNSFQEQFELLRHRNSASAWFKGIREQGLKKFVDLGFPTRRDEEWRFIDISPIGKANFSLPPTTHNSVEKNVLSDFSFGGLDCHTLVFIDGQYSTTLSLTESFPDGLVIGEFSSANKIHPLIKETLSTKSVDQENAFTALNDAFLNHISVVHIPNGVTIDKPIHLLYLTTDLDATVAVHPRNVIVAGGRSQATIIESYAGLGKHFYLNNCVSKIVLGESAKLNHIKIQRESPGAYHVGHLNVVQKRDSQFVSNSITQGSKLTRNNINVFLEASGCECTLNGLYLGANEQTIDNHTRIDHAQPHCNSHELYKGILGDKSSAVFNGKIHVHPDAQKTDAKQTNRVLLLSDDAKINTKPELEIYADDVKCTHGATVGQLDLEALFYLRSRGITKERAYSILSYAFGAEALEKVNIEEVKTEIEGILHSHFL